VLKFSNDFKVQRGLICESISFDYIFFGRGEIYFEYKIMNFTIKLVVYFINIIVDEI